MLERLDRRNCPRRVLSAVVGGVMHVLLFALASVPLNAAVLDAGASLIQDEGPGVSVALSLSEPVPWRLSTLDGPRRLVIGLSGTELPASLSGTDRAQAEMQREAEWGNVVLALDAPYAVDRAEMKTGDGETVLYVSLVPTSPEEFAASADVSDTALDAPPSRPSARREKLTIMLDPGHGGFDPGAEAGGLVEAELMLTFAHELKAILEDAAGVNVLMTREDDRFVPLTRRLTMARAAEADAFLSLHADTVTEGSAQTSGATIYTLSTKAADAATLRHAERHGQADLLIGTDLSGQEDEIALVLMDLARRKTQPRAEDLADMLAFTIRDAAGHTAPRPRRTAAFSVLTAPDIPSVLIEVGFLSNETDRQNLVDPEWRAEMARAIAEAIALWSDNE